MCNRMFSLAMPTSGTRLLTAILLFMFVVGETGAAFAESQDDQFFKRRGDIPRTPSGRPNFNGVWQAMGNAHWNIETHVASAALAFQPGPMGPVPATQVLALGAVPSGTGMVVGGTQTETVSATVRPVTIRISSDPRFAI